MRRRDSHSDRRCGHLDPLGCRRVNTPQAQRARITGRVGREVPSTQRSINEDHSQCAPAAELCVHAARSTEPAVSPPRITGSPRSSAIYQILSLRVAKRVGPTGSSQGKFLMSRMLVERRSEKLAKVHHASLCSFPNKSQMSITCSWMSLVTLAASWPRSAATIGRCVSAISMRLAK